MSEVGKIKDIDMFLQLDAPSDAEQYFTNGGDLTNYRSKVTSANLMVAIGNTTWMLLPDSTKKDLVATWENGLRKLYSGSLPDVTVSNGVRTVAEGTYDIWSGNVNVDLK